MAHTLQKLTPPHPPPPTWEFAGLLVRARGWGISLSTVSMMPATLMGKKSKIEPKEFLSCSISYLLMVTQLVKLYGYFGCPTTVRKLLLIN